ncbi:hypothetical protein Tco_0769416 [Tanacetum coccineum]|uniref:Uncharacterized protein n=1 Tax=Tanacetum coccineum TaxID=301880 RepID=A0ABQ4ZAD3_9ASTR
MKRKRIETSKTDLKRSKTGGHLQELEQAAKSKIYALMWVVQMEREVANDNKIAQKLLDVVKDVDKSLKKRRGIIDELKVKKDYAHDDLNFYGCARLRLTFDPTKSPDYKVVRAGRNSCEIVIQIYYSEFGNWTLCRERFTYFFFVHFDSAIYWNDALHWLETENRRLAHYKLNIEDHEHPIITTIQISQDHEQPIITTMLLMIISIRIPHMLHLEGKLFESLGCLVIVRRDCNGSSKFTIYQMRKGCPVWSREREEDSFLIINLCAKVVQYNLISKTLREIYDMGSNEIADDYLHDPRINLRKYTIENSFTLGSTEEADKVKILQACNDYANVDSDVYGYAGLRLAFDPTKSPYYKAVRAGRTCSDIFIQIYYSEKSNWSMCNERFNYFFFLHFDSAMYWNNALHWLETENSQLTHYKLNIEYLDHLTITIIQIPQSLQQGRNFFKSYGNILPMIITIQIPHILHLEGKLFDLRGCLLLVRRDDFGSSEFTIYEMMKGSSVWSVRYHVDTDDFMTPLPEGWSIRSTVWSIVLGEKEDDSFMVINLSGKVVEYNLMSKNLREMYDMRSNQLTDDYHDGFIPPGFIPPFAMYDMRPKQVDHKVYEFIPSYASV